MRSSLTTTLLWAVLLLADAAVVGAIGEVWVRAFLPTMNICYESDAEVGVRFCPDQRTYGYVEGDYANVFVTNSEGFHDREREIRKPEGVYRIQVYGDSMVQGKALQVEDTITGVVENHLNKSLGGAAYEVSNMASGDDSTSNQIRTYEVLGRRHTADLVVCYFSDDFGDNVFEVHGREYSPYHVLERDGSLRYVPPVPKDTSTAWERFKKSSLLYRILSNKFHESKFYHDTKIFFTDLWVALKPGKKAETADMNAGYAAMRREVIVKKSWPLTLRLISHFKELVARDGARFVLVDGLAFSYASEGIVRRNEDLRRHCEEQGIDYLPVYPKLEQLKSYPDRKTYFFRDNHPTPVANRELAGHVGKLIEGLIARKAAPGRETPGGGREASPERP